MTASWPSLSSRIFLKRSLLERSMNWWAMTSGSVAPKAMPRMTRAASTPFCMANHEFIGGQCMDTDDGEEEAVEEDAGDEWDDGRCGQDEYRGMQVACDDQEEE